MRQKRRSYREPDDDEDVHSDELAAVSERLDDLTRQLERMAHANAAPRAGAVAADVGAPDRVADALARLDRRLDQVIAENRASTNDFHRQGRYAPPAAPPPMPAHLHAPIHAPLHASMRPPMPAPAPPPPAAPTRGPSNWAAQISARQRALDGGPAAPAAAPPVSHPVAPPAAPANWGPAQDLSGLEHQLRQINTQISALHQPYEHALGALRGDLAEIGRALTEAMPRRAVEALEGEVRALAERVNQSRQAGTDATALGALERELTEIRNALRGLTPAESLAGFQEAVHALSHKIDQIGAGAHTPQDPMAFKQLEQAVVSLRGVVSNVASDGALAQLSAEVRGLAAQFERTAADSSSEALGKLEARIAALMESGRAVPPELEGSIRALSERLDRAHLSQGDQLALGTLEDRIAKLSEKLDASDARLNHLDAIERGLADLLVHLEEMRNGGPRGLRAPAPPEPSPAPAAPPPPAPVAPASVPVFAQSPLDLIPELPPAQAPAVQMPEPTQAPPAPVATFEPPPATFAPPPPPPPPPPQSRPRPAARPMPRGPERQPIDPNLPPDTPLEPGSGVPRVKPGSAAARIAASEAALAHSRPMNGETGVKSAAMAAARSAAKAAYLDTPVKVPKSFGPKPAGLFKWPFKKKAKALPLPQIQAPDLAPRYAPMSPPPSAPTPAPASMSAPALPPMPAPMLTDSLPPDAPVSRGGKILKVLKTLLIAASVAIIVVGTAQTAIELLFPDKPAATPDTGASKDEPQSSPKKSPPATTPSRPMPAPEGALPTPPAADPEPTGSTGDNASFFDPHTVIPSKQPRGDITGSIARRPVPPRPQTPANPPSGHSALDGLPATIGPVLRTAVSANDPAAEYELGSRYAEGRGVAQSMPEAVQWFERAATAGFAPAQFRLASLNEKGEGVKKNVQEARRLYLAAAAKGHAKAMHNLAVLYAEGIDGKPDYKVAAEWFRKAAMYGVADSQYNLAILYARGIGIPVNLAESYRWFAIAAASGDQDSTRKRDEVAARLDKQTLMAAKLAAQSFVPDHEPDEATNLKAPPGGWDHTPAPPAKPRRQIPAR